jgi:AraC family transcriptional regulator, transcriptional activator of pobA
MSDDVADSLLPEGSMLLGFFSSLQVIDVTKQTLGTFRAILDLVKQSEDELFSEKPVKKLMIRSLFLQLFILIFRLQEQQEKYLHFQDPQALKYFQQFQKNITSSEYPKSIPKFAQDLGISTVHLNRVCQAVTGKSASLIIQEYLVKKAQHYLNHSSYSVSEIAYMLRFAYPNYFARLFKKHTGISPKEYREMGRGYSAGKGK